MDDVKVGLKQILPIFFKNKWSEIWEEGKNTGGKVLVICIVAAIAVYSVIGIGYIAALLPLETFIYLCVDEKNDPVGLWDYFECGMAVLVATIVGGGILFALFNALKYFVSGFWRLPRWIKSNWYLAIKEAEKKACTENLEPLDKDEKT